MPVGLGNPGDSPYLLTGAAAILVFGQWVGCQLEVGSAFGKHLEGHTNRLRGYSFSR